MPQINYDLPTKVASAPEELQKFRGYLVLTKKLWEMPANKRADFLRLIQDALTKFNSDNVAMQAEALKISGSLLNLPAIQIDKLVVEGELQNILESYAEAVQGLVNDPAFDFNKFTVKETNRYITKMNLMANMIDFHIKVSGIAANEGAVAPLVQGNKGKAMLTNIIDAAIQDMIGELTLGQDRTLSISETERKEIIKRLTPIIMPTFINLAAHVWTFQSVTLYDKRARFAVKKILDTIRFEIAKYQTGAEGLQNG